MLNEIVAVKDFFKFFRKLMRISFSFEELANNNVNGKGSYNKKQIDRKKYHAMRLFSFIFYNVLLKCNKNEFDALFGNNKIT